MNEKISVVIPLFNKERYIARTLDSVLKQTFKDFEVIVVDDGSTDNGAEIVRGFDDPRIQLIQQVNQGESAARNRGVDEAKSDFVAFLDADDEWMPKHLEIIFRLIEHYPAAGMFASAYKIQTANGRIHWPNYKCIPNPPWEGLLQDYFKSGAYGDYPVNSSVAVIPKKILKDVGGFPEGYWWAPDADLFGKIALKYPVAFSWELGAIYHFDAENRACEREYPRDYEEPFVKTARSALMKGEVQPDLVESVKEYIAKKEIFRAHCNLHDGNLKNTVMILKQCPTRLYRNERIKLLILAKMPSPVFLFLKELRRKLIKIVRK